MIIVLSLLLKPAFAVLAFWAIGQDPKVTDFVLSLLVGAMLGAALADYELIRALRNLK